jgi:subtilisin family serine protease
MKQVRLALIALATLPMVFAPPARASEEERDAPRHREVIVQSPDLDEAAEAIDAVGGVVSHELKVIHAVGVRLTEEQISELRKRAKDLKLRIYTDFPKVRVDGDDSDSDSDSDSDRDSDSDKGKGKGKNKLDQVKDNHRRDGDYAKRRADLEGLEKDTEKAVAKRQRQRDWDARWGLDTVYPTLVDADKLHKEGIDGSGITIAVIDTGIWTEQQQVAEGLAIDTSGRDRILAQYNATLGKSTSGPILDQLTTSPGLGADGYGHGTHVASVALSSLTEGKSKGKGHGSPLYNGIAPNADLVVVKAFDDLGLGSYLDVIRAVDWVVQNKDSYGIRVLNLSFSGEAHSYYWDDPLNQAVMAAWQSGIVVVASAGNRGPDPMTIGVPGNVPYIITVGAMSDRLSNSPSDDFLASFSSTGPTFEGFVKPEIVAPGGHVMGLMSKDSWIATEHPEFHDGGNYFVMSGTSQATAIVSGVAALLLEADPTLTPDEVKCRLMSTARPATTGGGGNGQPNRLAYSVFQQGAGLVNARDAVDSDASGCANQGIDIELDVLGRQHYRGRANFSDTDGFYIEGLQGDGYLWNDGYLWSDGYNFRKDHLWPDGFLWSDGFMWNDGFLWNDGYLWSDGFLWNDVQSQSMSTNAWVPQE